MKKYCGLLTVLILQACQGINANAADQFKAGRMAEGAPSELMHWGKLAGQWTCTEEALGPDGKTWQSAGTSDWDFLWAFDGWGIQDNYFSPSRAEALEDESKRQRGINLRIYNPAEKKWILTWLTTQSTTPTFITAISDNEKILMSSTTPSAQGYHNQVTFFDMSPSKFEWKMEVSKDKEEWTEVYRIHCNIKNR